jgi:impB/mucB/samB family C-terminal domain
VLIVQPLIAIPHGFRDLIQVPVFQISSVFKEIKHTEEASHQLFMKFRDRCRGLDTTTIVDDVGGLSKQVSVEDSFRRGTLTTIEAAKTALRQLIDRIERLLNDRQIDSLHPSQAYPITVRVTARVVDPNNASIRRPFKTTSKQCPFNGKLYMKSNQDERQRMLQAIVEPLLTRLVMQNHGDTHTNLTRLNLAMSNFQDINWKSVPETVSTNQILSQKGKNISNSFFKLSLPAKRDLHALKAKNIHVDKSVMAEVPQDIALEVRWIDQIPKTRSKQPRIDTFFHRK